MNITHLIAESIMQAYEGNNWTSVSIAETLQNVIFQEAMQQTNGSPNTIASLTHHLQYWNEIMMKRINGEAPEIGAANGFDVPAFQNEEAWKQLIESTHQSFIELSNAVKNFPEEKLMDITPKGKSSYYKNMQGIAEHAYYHLGQILIIKHLVKAGKPV